MFFGGAPLPYQYPLADGSQYPVVRIPVSGPEPYNTLVVVRTRVPLVGDDELSNGKLHSWQLSIGTPFHLIGFDPRTPPVFTQSTTASIQMVQTSRDGGFLWAVDEVSGGFDNAGQWVVIAKVSAGEGGHGSATSTAYSSSWVLCYEPPPPAAPRGHARFSAVASGVVERVDVSVAYGRTRIGARRGRSVPAYDAAAHSTQPPVPAPARRQARSSDPRVLAPETVHQIVLQGSGHSSPN